MCITMPRKTDGIAFELQPRPTKGEDGKPLLYAQPVIKHKYTLKGLEEFCVKYRRMQKGEIQQLFGVLEDVVTTLLKDGNRVETPFGTFAPKLKLQGEHTDPNKVKGRDVKYGGIEFIPSKDFIEKADCSHHGFRRKKTVVGNSQMYDAKAMDEALSKCTKRHGFTTINTFMVFSGLKYKSAKKYLDSLCQGEQPRLYRLQEGRAWHYFVNKEIHTP